MPATSRTKNKGPAVSREEVIEVLKGLLDPELGIDVYTLGFVRRIDLDPAELAIGLTMTLTSPLCPYGPRLVDEIEAGLRRLGLKKISVEFVFDPPWEPSAEVRQMLGL